MGPRSIYLKRCCPNQKEVIHIPPAIPEDERLYVDSQYQEGSQEDHSVTLSSGIARSLNHGSTLVGARRAGWFIFVTRRQRDGCAVV